MAIKYSTQNIPAVINRKVFFDANVLLYIFWPSGSYHWESYYSSAYARLVRQGNELLVDFIVISEIVNRAIRLEYDKHLLANNITRNNLSFKNYRNSPDGETALIDIYSMIETEILNTFTVVGKSFTKPDIQSFLTVDSLDFGDKAILSTCQENACILLTNDVDYKTSAIDILTSNPAILKN
jgi:predicted nucleic acid-binding protein